MAAAPVTVQSVIVSKDRFTEQGARDWITGHDFALTFQGKPMDETSTSYRFRQRDPGAFVAGSLRTIQITSGVALVVGRLK